MRPFNFSGEREIGGAGEHCRRGHGGGFGRGLHGGFGGGRGGQRFFEHGDIRLVLLWMLTQQPAHGYELIKSIEEKMNGAYAPSPGVIYPTLTMLEETEFISSEGSEGARRLYTVTEKGKEFLASHKDEVGQAVHRMEAASEHAKRTAHPQILRALENLRMALHLKCEGAVLKPEQIKAVASVLDEAAGKIENC